MVALVTIVGVVYLFACILCIKGVRALARKGYRRVKSGFHIGRSGFFVEADDNGTWPGGTTRPRRHRSARPPRAPRLAFRQNSEGANTNDADAVPRKRDSTHATEP